MFHSIRWRIAIPSVLLILLTMLGLGIYLSSFSARYIWRTRSQLANEFLLVRDSLVEGLLGGANPETLDQLAGHWGGLVRAG